MLTIRECRKILGKKYEKYTDEQIKQIRDFLDGLAIINARIIRNHREKEEKEKG